MDIASAALGASLAVVTGGILALIRYGLQRNADVRQRDLGIATLVGKVEAKLDSILRRLGLVEDAMVKLGGKMDIQSEALDDQRRQLTEHIRDETDRWPRIAGNNSG